MQVIIQGHWASYVGTDYCAALGNFDSLEDKSALAAAEDYAWSVFEEDEDAYEDGEYVGEGPDYWLEEYNPEIHDSLRAGGGSFADDFD
jgi:hypothetical protein